MKRIEFIAPVEALRGNMSGSQTLVYAENDNPAYEAPDGRQYARNYKPRYIGFRRAKDGAVYFGVKRKSATKVDPASRITMAAMGTLQTLKNTLKQKDIQISSFTGKAWSFILGAYNVAVEEGEISPDTSFEKWADQQLIDMLRYKQQYVTFKPFKSPSQLSFNVYNPYLAFDDTDAELISPTIFAKFNPVLTTIDNAIVFYINGKPYVTEDAYDWISYKNDALGTNYVAYLAPLAATGDDEPATWNGKALYSSAGVAQTGATSIVAGEKYTTIAPTA